MSSKTGAENLDCNTTEIQIRRYDFAINRELLSQIDSLFKKNNLYIVDHDDVELMMSRLFLVAIIEGNLVAASECRFEDDNCLKILNFAVEKKYQNMKIGTFMLANLEIYIEAFHKNVKKLSCIAGDNSRMFYEKKGYEYDGMFHNKLVSK